MASTGGIYLGIPGTVAGDQPLHLESLYDLIGFQKIVEGLLRVFESFWD